MNFIKYLPMVELSTGALTGSWFDVVCLCVKVPPVIVPGVSSHLPDRFCAITYFELIKTEVVTKK